MLKKKLLLSLSLVSIQGCVLLGAGTYQTLDTVTTGATAVSYGTTGKGLTDHAASAVTGKDCRMFNVLQHKNFCRVRKTYEVRNMQEGHRRQMQMASMQIINSLKEKEKVNVTRLGKGHERDARKVRCARSRVKNGCK
jgi:hypothetical protein